MSQDAEAGTAEKSPLPDSRGGTFGRYRLIERIGAGGMAEIYRAVAVGAQGFERTVAIKRIREEIGEVADIGKLFADEARLSALLNHPNIVQVYDFGAVEGTYYIAMEYLKGRNLDQVLYALRRQSQRLEPALAVFVAHEVARALAYAHSLRDEDGRPLEIIHRDISPANIMLMQVGAVKLLDFGIARITSELRLAVTQGRALRGKCPYLAPEQISGGAIDGRADIFALGVVLWEMLTGERLFAADSDLDSIASVLNREIPPPSSYAPEVPAAIDRVVLAMLARDLPQRYRSAEALAGDLHEAMRALPSRQRDLPDLLRRLFPPITGEMATVSPAGGAPAPAAGASGSTPPRFAVEVPTMAEGPRPAGAGPRDITLPAMALPGLPAPALAQARPDPVDQRSEVTAKITPVTKGLAGVRAAGEAAARAARLEGPARPSRRRALLTVLGTVVATELVVAGIHRGLDVQPWWASPPLASTSPSATGVSSASATPVMASERCLPARPSQEHEPPTALTRPAGASAAAPAPVLGPDKPAPAARAAQASGRWRSKRASRRALRAAHAARKAQASQALSARKR